MRDDNSKKTKKNAELLNRRRRNALNDMFVGCFIEIQHLHDTLAG